MPIPQQWPRSIVLTVLAAALAMGLAGCGVSSSSLTSSLSSTPSTGEAFGGQIFGGNQPVSNAVIQMYEPGTNGYGTAATPLLNRLVMTDANGQFSLANAFTCPSSATPVYLVVTGGNPGLASGTNNKSLAMMGLLGACGSSARFASLSSAGRTFRSVLDRTEDVSTRIPCRRRGLPTSDEPGARVSRRDCSLARRMSVWSCSPGSGLELLSPGGCSGPAVRKLLSSRRSFSMFWPCRAVP